MLRPRIIPCLLIENKGLVKTVQFKNPVYVGDPINAVRIFNEKEADEIIILDIKATADRREPDYRMIELLASECRMPFCYGGGINSVKIAEKIFCLGVEKIAISSAVFSDNELIKSISNVVGSQSVVVILDVKKKLFGGYEVVTGNGKNYTDKSPLELAKRMQDLGAGEIVINSVDKDGMLSGYDLKLAELVRKNTTLPLTILGGAGSLSDIGSLINELGIVGASAGSLFVFRGKYKAVLINYPTPLEKNELIKANFLLNQPIL